MSEDSRSTSVTRIPIEAFAGQCRRHLVNISGGISAFEAVSLAADQHRQFLQEPLQALPTALLERLAPLRILLVPYLEKGVNGGSDMVSFEKPAPSRLLRRSVFDVRDEVFLLFAIEQEDVADYHYWLFNTIAGLAARAVGEEGANRFAALVFDELARGTRGEVDELSLQWKLKVQRRQNLPGHNTKLMRQYIRHALEDTLTLYLHGLCCDIDVEPGPRQLSTRYLRARLELLAEVFPPNSGYVLFAAPQAPAAGQESETL